MSFIPDPTKLSSCCAEPMFSDVDICPKCKEHTDIITVCELCGRDCTNLVDGICCLERNMQPYWFKFEPNPCDSCTGQKANLEAKMEKLK